MSQLVLVTFMLSKVVPLKVGPLWQPAAARQIV